MAENIRCFCPKYPTNIRKFAAKCEYPDIRIWENPLICSKIAKYPISESIIIYPICAANARNIPKYPPRISARALALLPTAIQLTPGKRALVFHGNGSTCQVQMSWTIDLSRNFEKSHRTTDPRSDLRPDSSSWANSGLESTFGNVETGSFWVTTRGA